MGLLTEFRDFALRGNVIDMAVGVIIGASFSKIVTSVTNDLMMPPISRLMSASGKALSFKDSLKYSLSGKDISGMTLEQALKEGPVLAFGNFIQTTLDFLILAICVFAMIKMIQLARERFETKKADAPTPAIPDDVKLLTEIRDLLAKR